MGLFLAMSGVANSTQATVEDALRAYATERGGTLEALGSSADLSEALLIAESGNHVTVMYPGDFVQWDAASEYLSQTLGTSVFSLHIHDEDLWMYVLFSKGKQVDQFNPIPNYWLRKMPENERQEWSGKAAVVGQHWPDLEPESIGNYLFEWDLEDDLKEKAYPDDNFPFNDCWQVTDFMRRLGLVYPIDDGGKVSGATYRFVMPNQG
ncbi:MAG: hypothetical protein ABSG53_28130 [Thermoguttaceae bacterium]|jgi:hypothetical protein